MSDSQEKRVLSLIKAHGGQLVRQRKHHIYRFPCGKNFVVANTPIDIRAWHHAHATLKRLLEIQRRVQKVALAPKSKRPSPKERQSYGVMKRLAPSIETSCSTLKSALEECLIEQNDFESLMLALGTKKLA